MQKIWDRAPQNAFTDLVRHEGRWLCCFREAKSHGRGYGRIRVIESGDGTAWKSIAEIAEPRCDLRDPKLSIMPDGRLMMVTGGSIYDDQMRYLTRRPRVSFSKDGRTWTPPRRVLAEDHWLWRVTWHDDKAYSLSKLGEGGEERRGFLYVSRNGIDWTWITEFKLEGVSETTLRFMPDDELIALIRPGYIGHSKPPYRKWAWHKMKRKIGGPNFIRVPDGTLWAAGRRYNPDGSQQTVLARMTRNSYTPLLALPSSGDNSYPGMVYNKADGLLWMSYYSSHEGKASIYLAKIALGG